MSDLGFILLRILRPWSSRSDFTEACIEKTSVDKGHISNLIEEFTAESRNFMSRSAPQKEMECLEEEERLVWNDYAREMIEFYVDLVGAFLSTMANYQFDFEPEDVFIITELSELYKVNGKKRIFDGMVDVDKFKENLRMHTYYSANGQGMSFRPFIDEQFWTFIDRILNKLVNYNFANVLIHQRKMSHDQAQTSRNDLERQVQYTAQNFNNIRQEIDPREVDPLLNSPFSPNKLQRHDSYEYKKGASPLQVFPTQREDDHAEQLRESSLKNSKTREINEWKRPLSYDEYKVLFYIFFFLSFVIDFTVAHAKRLWQRSGDKIPIRSGELPQSQFLRQYVNLYATLRVIIALTSFYFFGIQTSIILGACFVIGFQVYMKYLQMK